MFIIDDSLAWLKDCEICALWSLCGICQVVNLSMILMIVYSGSCGTRGISLINKLYTFLLREIDKMQSDSHCLESLLVLEYLLLNYYTRYICILSRSVRQSVLQAWKCELILIGNLNIFFVFIRKESLIKPPKNYHGLLSSTNSVRCRYEVRDGMILRRRLNLV